MAQEKNILEEAIIQMKNLEEAVTENAKGILASTMRQEIKDLVKESLNEDDEIEDDEVEMNLDSDDEDEIDLDSDDEDEIDLDSDDEVIDLTGEEDIDVVMKVFKLMSPEDEIEVKKDESGNIHLKDNQTDNEYLIMTESEIEEYFNQMDEDEEGENPDLESEIEKMFQDTNESEEIDYKEVVYEIEMDEDYMMDEGDYMMDEEEHMMDEGDYMMDEEEHMMDEENYMMESKKSMKPKGVGMGHGPKFNYGKIMDFPTKKMKKGDEAPYSGKGPKYNFDKKSPSLRGEFKEAKYGMNKGDKSKTHDGEEDYTGKKGMMSKTHSGFDFGKKEKKEGMMKTHQRGEFKEASRTLGSGSKFRDGGLPKPRAHSAFNANIKKESINSQEVNLLREKNEEYRKALNVFRNKLNEVAVFNSNLAYATRLFTEHSTSKQEKINILQRFDGVESLKESKNLYKTIKDELSTSKTQQVNESIERTIQKTPTNGSSINLIESKTYENPQFLRMKDLMSKLK